ncbi:hypothetical protein MTO96_003867 [Rhipicephalus appendiculatus]
MTSHYRSLAALRRQQRHPEVEVGATDHVIFHDVLAHGGIFGALRTAASPSSDEEETRQGCRLGPDLDFRSPLLTRSPPSPQGTVPHSETRQVDQVVPIEADISSQELSSKEDEGSSAPHSVDVKEEQVAAEMATAPRSAQPDTATGDSPLLFWAEAAPAQQGE